MREAIGGSWLYYLVVTFLLIYVFFMSFVMNYAAAYRAANYVVTQIETCQAQDKCTHNNLENVTKQIWSKYKYRTPNGSALNICCMANGNGSVYRVTLPVAFDVPIIGTMNWINARAETKTILNVYCPQNNSVGAWSNGDCK